MEMKKISVKELKPGMVFDKAVYIDMNNILVAPMVPLKEEDINRLIKWGIEEVETAGEIIKEGQVKQSRDQTLRSKVDSLTAMMSEKAVSGARGEKSIEDTIEDIYEDTVKLVEDIFSKVRNGVGYDKEKILNAVDKLIDAVRSDKNTALEVCTREREGSYLSTLGVSVAFLAIVTGVSLGYAKHRLMPLGIGALLHDIGMVRVPSYISEKKGPLSPDEYNRIKTHTLYGYRILTRELDLTNEMATIALQHHEAYDGSGYPRKLKGDAISDFAKIVSVCDAYMAMIRRRSYREEHLSYVAMKNILSAANRKYDPAIVKAFLSNMAVYPVGSIVQLNNNAIGKVVSANPSLPLRPKIAILVDEFGEKLSGDKIIDLNEVSSLYIVKPLSQSIVKKILNE
jgi:HD-GYP domain-containing protein (c-di-GMP phosphodiesterase class II)